MPNSAGDPHLFGAVARPAAVVVRDLGAFVDLDHHGQDVAAQSGAAVAKKRGARPAPQRGADRSRCDGSSEACNGAPAIA
jgi:hypothetical protein